MMRAGQPSKFFCAGTFCTLTSGADTQPVDPGGNVRPLPANGRAVAVHAGRTAAALLELPAGATRDTCGAELPPVMWLTLGLLATDGLVLQACPDSKKPLRKPVTRALQSCRPSCG